MSMLDGISQCWLLSRSCEINWDALAAIGTVAAVFVALFGPTFQRRLIRRKANALFALAFRADVLTVLVKLLSIKRQFQGDGGDQGAAGYQELIKNDESARASFLARARALDVLSKRELDMSKWPSVELDLAADVARAIEAVRHFQEGAEVLARPADDRDWDLMFGSIDEVIRDALMEVDRAERALLEALVALPERRSR